MSGLARDPLLTTTVVVVVVVGGGGGSGSGAGKGIGRCMQNRKPIVSFNLVLENVSDSVDVCVVACQAWLAYYKVVSRSASLEQCAP